MSSSVPRRRSSFLGRDADLAAIVDRLDRAPAVTLVGVGGVGKTSLAYAVAARIDKDGAAVVHLVDLVSTRDDTSVARVVADALGLPATSERTPEDAVAGLLEGEGPALLLLDNCEQVVPGVVGLVDGLLDRCPELSVLATSRVALGVDGEQVWPVEPLDVDTTDSGEAPAIQLIVDRATASHPNALAGVEHLDLVRLARRLDGIPLALELAAARLDTMGIGELTKRLDRELLELDSTRHDVTDRHRSLASVVEWSYRLLSEEEQRVAARLSVFRGSFTRDAAVDVVGEAASRLLDRLFRSSLLVVTERSGAARFQMLEMIREFLSAQLDRSGAAEETHRSHARWAARTAGQLASGLRGADESQAVPRFAAEEANIGAALTWALDHDEVALATELVRGLQDHVLSRAGREVHAWIDHAADRLWDEPAAGDVLIVAAVAAMCRGDILRNRVLLEQTETLGATGKDLIVSRDVDWWSVLTFEGRVGEAVELARSDPDVSDDPWTRGYTLVRRAMPFAYAGHGDRALEYSDQALAIADELANPTLQGWSHYVRGESLMGIDPDAAIAAYTEAARRAESVGNTFLAGLLSVARASALGRHGQPVETLEQFRSTIIRWRDAGAWSFLSTSLRNFGEFLIRLERYEEATRVRCGVEGRLDSSAAGGVDADRDRFLRQQVIDRLGRARFEELREQAHGLTRDELVDLALDILDTELRTRRSTSEFRVIVFTDLEESTAFMADRKDRLARDQMREYDLLTQRVLDRHDGQRVKGTGDGVLATFRSVGEALSGAVDLQREVDEAVEGGALPLRLRVGIHAGETIWDMDDVHGTVVNLAARVVDRARGGEIVATETVRQIALGLDYEFTPMGEAELKGIPEPVGLHRLEWQTGGG